MRVLRANKDSVMAMLEAFVHDPLINWRLLNTTDATAEATLVRDAEQSQPVEGATPRGPPGKNPQRDKSGLCLIRDGRLWQEAAAL